MYRTERDVLGEVKVPVEAYYGKFTVRAENNFQISGRRPSKKFLDALACIKLAAAKTNASLGTLKKVEANAIIKATQEVLKGKFADQFILDVYQAGAGTPYNMNMNEVIANRANELFQKEKGSYSPVHPNDQVNMAQSSNDIIPTAVRICTMWQLISLHKELARFQETLQIKARQFSKIIKVGRTHFQDAVPMSLGQEFAAYAEVMKKNSHRLRQAITILSEVHIGGTAIGSGINTHPNFRKHVVRELSKITKLRLVPTKNPFALTQGMADFSSASGAVKCLALDLAKIAGDLMFYSSGPKTGIQELELPEVEPGSSIMPGKVNPSIPEAMQMIAFQVVGNDTAIDFGVQSGNMQLNVMTPLILENLSTSITILTTGIAMFRTKCVMGMKANVKQINKYYVESLATATALNPYIGYSNVAELVQEALQRDIPLKDIIIEKGIYSKKELDTLLSQERVTQPAIIDKKMKK